MKLAKKLRRPDRTVIFEVKTERPLPVGQQVFITGSVEMLGHWKADGFPLTRMGENLWAGSAMLPAGEMIEFKVTRGTWDTEEVQADGTAPENSTLKPGSDASVRKTVTGWKDETAR
jgi:hypothetical protein